MKRNLEKYINNKKQNKKNENNKIWSCNQKNIKKMEKYAMEFTFGALVGVEASSSNLHMARTREVPC